MIERRKSRQISVGNIKIGGDAAISVQSMTKTDTRDAKSTIKQIKLLEKHGCEIIRVAVPDSRATEALSEIKKNITIPLIADIHFDYRLALKSINNGVDGLRINPGNIGEKWKIKEVVKAAKERKIPIRIGVNSGSLDKDILKIYGYPCPDAMVESALKHIRILEGLDYREIKISLKASSVIDTIDAYRILSDKIDYPFHLGITEAGTCFSGAIKSSVGIGILINEGIGDTIRVSLTAPPQMEVRVGIEILKSLRLRRIGVEVISCPMCGRARIDVMNLVNQVEKKVKNIKIPLKIAVMGCVVNGPGEAKEADIGIAGGARIGTIFAKGIIIKKLQEDKLLNGLMEEISKYIKQCQGVNRL